MNTQLSELSVHSHMNAQTISFSNIPYPPELNSVLHSHLDHDDRTDSTNSPDLVGQAEKRQRQISSTIWEHNILIYCIFNAELDIILLYWNKQHLESSIIKWGCCLLDENFHLALMFTCFGSMQIWIGLNIEPSSLHFSIRLTKTCLRSRHLHVAEKHTCTMVF